MAQSGPGFRISVRGIRGMVRQASALVLPPQVLYLAQNLRLRSGLARRRPGAVVLYRAAAPANGSLEFTGANDKRVEFPDVSQYDLGTKWAVLVWAKTAGVPGGTQYLFGRDVTPTSAGEKTWAVSINASLQLGFEMWNSAGTATPLTAAAASLVTASTWFTVLIVRDGATLSMYVNGNPTPVLTRTDLNASLSNRAGATAAFVGLNSNDDGVANFTGLFNGSIALVALFTEYKSVTDLLQYTAFQKYPDPRDPTCILYAPFCYSKEAGTTAIDWSLVGNDGTLDGGTPPARGADHLGEPTNRVQGVTYFGNAQTGLLKNVALIGGNFLHATAREAS